MKRIKLVLILMSCSIIAMSQINVGITLNTGFSKLSGDFNEINLPFMHDYESYDNKEALLAGFCFSYSLGDKKSINAEIQYNHMRSQKVYEYKYSYTNPTTNYLNKVKNFRFSQITFPVYFSYNYGNLSFTGGLRGSVLINGSESDQATYNNLYNFDTEKEIYRSKIIHEFADFFDIGPILGVSFHLMESLSLNYTYYYGFLFSTATETYQNNRVNQMLVGFKYSFII